MPRPIQMLTQRADRSSSAILIILIIIDDILIQVNLVMLVNFIIFAIVTDSDILAIVSNLVIWVYSDILVILLILMSLGSNLTIWSEI